MPRPIVNLDEVTLSNHGHGERFAARLASLAPLIGAKKLGARLCVVPPGKAAWPFHAHMVNEEMVVVLSGSGCLRLGDERHSLHAGDAVSLPPGGPESAHQILNDSGEDLRYLAISTMEHPDVFHYPDSGKFGVFVGAAPGGKKEERRFEFFGRKADGMDYWDGED